MGTQPDSENMKGAVAYLLFFVTGIALLVIEKKSKFVRFHALQSTVVFGGLALLGLIPFIGWALWLILPFVIFVLWLLLMWKAYNGEMYKLPVIGDFVEKQLPKLG